MNNTTRLQMPVRRSVLSALVPALALAFAALTRPSTVRADERFFTYSQDADVLPKGRWEFEQWVTLRHGRASESFSAWDLREEIEYGLTDKLSLAGYLNFRQTYRDSSTVEESEFEFKGVSAELKYQLLNPNTKPLGIALYLEPTYNGREVELEEILIFQKNFGEKWITAFNVKCEQEWEREGDETHEETKLEFTAGVAYRLNPKWSLGLEGRHRRIYEDIGFNDREAYAWFVGPNVHYSSARWWGTLTILPQVSGSPSIDGRDLAHHERFEVRLILGINF